MRPQARLPRIGAAATATLGLAVLASGCSPAEESTSNEETSQEQDAEEQPAAVPPRQMLPSDRPVFGVNPDWGVETLSQFAETTGVTPGTAVSFVEIPFDQTDVANVMGAAEQVSGVGGVLLLTLEPTEGLDAVTEDVIQELVNMLQDINGAGVPVMLRYAHEMNGSWYAWGQQPEAYVESFRQVAEAVRATPATDMLWAPNYAGGYPFQGGAYAAEPGTSEFELLDTNGDSQLSETDDPYAPYYPGDDVVDWVGMTIYHWGNQYPWGGNELPEPGKFAEQITGNYNGVGGDDTVFPDFYTTYAEERDKPMAIPETAAFVTEEASPELSLDIKQAWWRQIFSEDLRTQFPQIRVINWFNWDKDEAEVDSLVRWSVTTDEQIAESFRNDFPDWLATGDDL